MHPIESAHMTKDASMMPGLLQYGQLDLFSFHVIYLHVSFVLLSKSNQVNQLQIHSFDAYNTDERWDVSSIMHGCGNAE